MGYLLTLFNDQSKHVYIAVGVARGGMGPRPPKGVGKICTTVFAVQKGQIYVKVLCLVIVNVNVTKYMPHKCQI